VIITRNTHVIFIPTIVIRSIHFNRMRVRRNHIKWGFLYVTRIVSIRKCTIDIIHLNILMFFVFIIYHNILSKPIKNFK